MGNGQLWLFPTPYSLFPTPNSLLPTSYSLLPQPNPRDLDRGKVTMKYKYVFLLGRPGCGKSALYRELEKRILESGQAITFERVDDFPKLWAAVERDDALEKEGKERLYFKRFNDGELSLTNDNLFNVILKEVNSDVLKIDKPDHMIFLEFARSNYVEALQSFDKSLLDNCIAIYMRGARNYLL